MTTCAQIVNRTSVALLLALLLAPLASESQEAQTLSYGLPEDVGMSSSVLRGALGVYEEAIERGDLVGAVV